MVKTKIKRAIIEQSGMTSEGLYPHALIQSANFLSTKLKHLSIDGHTYEILIKDGYCGDHHTLVLVDKINEKSTSLLRTFPKDSSLQFLSPENENIVLKEFFYTPANNPSYKLGTRN